jgi:AraC-like DNA-binding protein
MGTESVRVIWPFLRYLSTHPRGARLLDASTAGASLVDPDGRIPLEDAARMLDEAIRVTGDPAIGLHAAACVEPADRDVLELAARSAETLRGALECTIRYYRLMTDEAVFSLELEAEQAALCRRSRDGSPSYPIATDFSLVSLVGFLRRGATIDESRCGLEFEYPRPSYAEEYHRHFRGTLRFLAGRNAFVFPRAFLDSPMQAASPVLAKAFALRADQLLARLSEEDTLAERVRTLTAQHLRSGQLTMHWIARSLGLSSPTLRRRLEAEQVTYSAIVDEVRRQLAERELGGKRSVSEITFYLGFSSVSAFDRAFRRWYGILPTEYRTRKSKGHVAK